MVDTPGDDRTLSGSIGRGRHNGIDVAEAEAEFNQLSRALSRRSVTQSQSENEKDFKEHRDVEKGAESVEEPFDLRAYLSSSNDARQQAGIQHKHVGVTWEKLQVNVFGGAGHRVSYFLRRVLLNAHHYVPMQIPISTFGGKYSGYASFTDQY